VLRWVWGWKWEAPHRLVSDRYNLPEDICSSKLLGTWDCHQDVRNDRLDKQVLQTDFQKSFRTSCPQKSKHLSDYNHSYYLVYYLG